MKQLKTANLCLINVCREIAEMCMNKLTALIGKALVHLFEQNFSLNFLVQLRTVYRLLLSWHIIFA